MIKQKVSGTVYGVVLNDHASVRKIGDALAAATYKGAPNAPAMYIKPANTRVAESVTVNLPKGAKNVEVGATVGLVMARAAARLTRANALDAVAGIVLAGDLSLPHDSYYRPAIRQRDRDGFCPISRLFNDEAGFDLDNATLSITINGERAYERSFATLVRSAAQLLADVTEFMTLSVGDVLLLGPGEGSPIARAGDTVTIKVPGLGQLRHTLVAEEEGQNA